MRCRDIVRAEFARRRQANPRYSVRRFAHVLGISHSTLSRLLRGEGPLPARTVRALCGRLAIDGTEVDRLVAREAVAAVAMAIQMPAFKPDSRHLAVLSGVPIDDVNIALHALLRDGHLRMTSPRDWIVSTGVSS